MGNFMMAKASWVALGSGLQIHRAGIAISNEEIVVIGVVLLILVLFEMGPKALNFIKNKRSKN